MRPLIGNGEVTEVGGAPSPPSARLWADGAVAFDRRDWTCEEATLDWTSPAHLLVLTERGGTGATEIRIDGGRRYVGRDAPGALSFVPAGVRRRGVYRVADMSYSALWIDPDMAKSLSVAPDFATPDTVVNGMDPVISALLTALGDAVAEGKDPGGTYVEHMAALILMRLTTLGGAAPAGDSAAALSRRALGRVVDHVEESLGRDISLSALAALVEMPVDRFARRFRAAMGMAPYAYVLERRVRRAERLLAETERPLASVALACGFSSQSHFTTAFRERTGLTPAAYRGHIAQES